MNSPRVMYIRMLYAFRGLFEKTASRLFVKFVIMILLTFMELINNWE